jgi:hypothetical protein
MLLVAMLEMRLALRGISSTQLDSEARWLEVRSAIAAHGHEALVLIGASRIQLGIDVPLLQRLSGKPTHQLAIDGTSYWPLLHGLSEDNEFTGTVVVDYYEHTQLDEADGGLAAVYEQHYQQKRTQLGHWNFDRLENLLEWRWRGMMRSYADGARPLDSLLYRILNKPELPQYLLTNFDRSRDADYSKLPMPDFYLARVHRHLGNDAPKVDLSGQDYPQLVTALRQSIDMLPVADTSRLAEKHHKLQRAVQKIQSRGGHVIFLVMPKSGMVRDIEQRRFPDALFLKPLRRALPISIIDATNLPQLADLRCPDGSHLDYRDKARFTTAFAAAAGLDGSANRHGQ